MKSVKQLVAIALTVFIAVFATTVFAAPLPYGVVLGLDQGVGSGTNIPCSTGSCFSMEVSPGFVVWTDFGPGTDGGIVVGKAQLSGGQELGGAGTDGELSNIWSFFSSNGTFFTSPGGDTQNIYNGAPCAGAACIGKTVLGVFNVAWNGSIIPLGSDSGCTLSSCSADQKAGIFVNDWQIDPTLGGAWSMNYSQVVPSGSFMNVKFSAIMRGTATIGDAACGLCDDSNLCTTDTCVNGVCVYTPKNCNDNNACTAADSCDPARGCVNTTIVCDDGNVCTIDSCNPVTGACVFTPMFCDDGNACTVDTLDCANIACIHTPIICNDNNVCTDDSCNAATGLCVNTPNYATRCNDNNVCTTDTCDAATGGCVNTLISGCGLPGHALPSGTLLALDQGTGSLTNTPCSTGSCFAMEVAPGFVVWTDFGPGTDGGIVVGKAQLSGGQDSASGAIGTDGELSNIWTFFSNNGTFYTSPGGDIQNIYNNAPCAGAACIGKTVLGVFNVAWNGSIIPLGSDSGCTLSSCSADQKAGIFVNDWQHIDGGAWSMNYSQVVPSGAFANVKFSAIMRGTEINGSVCSNVNCNDNNVCTADSCNILTGACENTPISGPACNDGNACTVNDTCSSGVCVGTPINCDDGNLCTNDSCNASTGLCVNAANYATRCDDNNTCTTDGCDPVTGACTHVNNSLTCSDGSLCTTSDHCVNGACVGTAKVCNDNNVCTTDTCNPNTGACVGTANTLPCNDNNACTLNDNCSNKVCVGTPMNCNDSNFCTIDSCNYLTGVCTNTPGEATCGLPGMPLPDGTLLGVTQGVGSGTNIPCAAGSCFSMEVSPGFVVWTDFGPGTDGGIVVGKCQLSGGQELGGAGTDGELSNAWSFFSANGTFFTCPGGDTKNKYNSTPCAGADCIYKTELKVFNVAWNGGIIPLGSEAGCTLSSCTAAQKEGIFVNDWQSAPVTGSAWSMNYSQVVPNGGFANVKFSLIMRGKVNPGGCISSARCDDGNACTDDCLDVSGFCSNVPNTLPCNDGNACTVSDTCSGGVCAGTAINCDDGNVCTDDFCYLATGCGHTNNAAACNDDNACTVNDTCSGGVCVGTPKNCSDGDSCTVDFCNTTTGACAGTPIPNCAPGTPLPAGTLLPITQGVGSGTNTPCSAGSCFSMEVSPGFVVWTDFGPGTDGGIVVGKSQASGGQETGPCGTTPGELSAAWSFFGCYGTFFTSPDGGAKNIYNSTSCTGGDCIGKTELKVFNVAWNGNIIPLGSEAGCTLSSCSADQLAGIFVSDWQIDTGAGAWSMNYSQVVPSGSFQNVKFQAIMRGTVIVADPCATMVCDDGNLCTVDSCNPATGVCVHTPVSCPLDFPCDPADGLCKPMPCIPADCDDNNPCTTDTCEFRGVCMHTPIVCNDNNACTTDSCSTATGCTYTPVANGTPCPIGSCYAGVCYPPIGECGECVGDSQCPSGMRCDVGNGCYPSCDCLPGGSCPTVCTYHCVPGCNDNNLCTVDTYDPVKGCVFTPIICNDSNACTTDSCDPAIGVCTYLPSVDGSPCTLDSQAGSCTAGQCIPYPACPAGSVKQVLVRGGGQKPSGADLQIETSFTVMNAGCIVDSSASSVTCTPGTILQVNVRAGQGPDPTSATWQSNSIATDTNFMITCPDAAGEVGKLVLDNKDAAGGKDVDRITIYVQ